MLDYSSMYFISCHCLVLVLKFSDTIQDRLDVLRRGIEKCFKLKHQSFILRPESVLSFYSAHKRIDRLNQVPSLVYYRGYSG